MPLLVLLASPALGQTELRVSCAFDTMCIGADCFELAGARLSTTLVWLDDANVFAPIVGDARLMRLNASVVMTARQKTLVFADDGNPNPFDSAIGNLEAAVTAGDESIVLSFGGGIGAAPRRILTIRLSEGDQSELTAYLPSHGLASLVGVAKGKCVQLEPT